MNENKSNCKVIAVCVQKGGVGKTVSSISISAVLAEMGYRVLLIDNDPQADSSKGVGVHKPDGMQITIATVIDDIVHFRSFPKDKGIIHTDEHFDIVPCDNTYSGIEMQLISTMSREYFMKKYIDGIRSEYDYIIIDCPPNLGTLTINALTAADELLVPSQAQGFSALSIEQLLKTVQMIRQYPNPDLKIDGIFLTMFDNRRNEDRLIKESLTMGYDSVNILKTTIPQSIRASEAVTRHMSVINYEPQGKIANAYRDLVKEII